jgi:hypothetical protein
LNNKVPIFHNDISKADEASAIKNAVEMVFGKEKLDSSFSTCQLHFLKNTFNQVSALLGKAQVYIRLS